MSKPPKDACIVTVATAAHFLAGQQRLANSVKEWGDGVAMLNWQGFLPPGSPPHQAVPYAFKAYAIKAARDMGFKKILWLDTSMYMMAGWEGFWELLEERGNLFWQCDLEHCGFLCSDAALVLLGKTRESLMSVPLVQGGVFALDFLHPRTNVIWAYYWKHVHSGALIGHWSPKQGFVSDDKRVIGHRHDMPILSIACADNDVSLIQQPNYFTYPGRDNLDNNHICIKLERRPIP